MLIDIRKYGEPVKYKYELLKSDGFIYDDNGKCHELYQSLGMISDYKNDRIEFKLSGLDELTMEIPRKIHDIRTQQFVDNPFWTRIRGGYVIEVSNNISDERQRFLVGNSEISSSDTIYKKISAKSLEKEYSSKMLRNFKYAEDVTSGNIDSDIEKAYTVKEILDYINDKYMGNIWSVGYIDGNVAARKRTFDFAEGTIYTFFTEVQERFCCLFKYDTINKVVNVYDLTVYPVCPICHRPEYLIYMGDTIECFNPNCFIEATDENTGFFGAEEVITIEKDGEPINVLGKDGEKVNWKSSLFGKDSGLYLTDKNYIANFTETEDMVSLYTRLYIYGKDNIGITTATDNYTGQPYIENFSFFRNNKYMTDELLTALDRYDALIDTKRGEWADLIEERYALSREYSNAVVIPSDSRGLLDDLQHHIDIVNRLAKMNNSNISMETLYALKEELKEYSDTVITYLDENGQYQTESLEEMLDDMNTFIDGETESLVNISTAVKQVLESFEMNYNAIVSALNSPENLKDYSLNQLQEALDIYNARKEALENIQAQIVSGDTNPELTLWAAWETGDQLIAELIREDIETDTAEEIWTETYTITEDDIYSVQSGEAVTGQIVKIPLPSTYTAADRNLTNNILFIYLRKRNDSDDGYEDIVLQTEDVQYYIVENDITSSPFMIQQSSVSLQKAISALEDAISKKQAVVDEIVSRQNENEEKISALRTSMAKETAEDDNGLIFDDTLLKELNQYIIEGIYTNPDIGVADITDDVGTTQYQQRIDDLYQDGLTAFYSMYTPTVTFTIDAVNFMRDVRCQHDWHKVSLGDMIYVGHKDSQKDFYIVRITGIVYEPHGRTMELTLSNEDKFKANTALGEQLLSDMMSTTSTVSVNKENWNNAQSNAVTEIIENGWDAAVSQVTAGRNVNVVIDKNGITIINSLDPEKQMRLADNLLTFTEDSWHSTKLAISNGSVIAERVAGKLLVGTSLYIIATKSDGNTMTFRVDGDGVQINNGALTISPMNGNLSNTNGITLSPDPHVGFKCTCFDESANACFEIKINGQDGILMYTLDSSGEPKTYMFKAEPDGNLLVNGVVYAKDLCLGGINNQSVLTYIDSVTGVTHDDGDIAAISGKYISCAGLNIENGDKAFTVDDNANVTIRNGIIEMESGNNIITINPTDGIVFTSNGAEVINLNINNGSAALGGGATFGGTINTAKDCVVGENITVGKDSTTGTINFGGMTSTPTAVIKGYEENGKLLELSSEAIILNSDVGVYINNATPDNIVATKADIDNLIEWISSNFQHKTSSDI